MGVVKLALVCSAFFLLGKRQRTPVDEPGDGTKLGEFIKDEVDRAEADYASLRTRAQSILTVSGLLVTALAGLLALAVGRDQFAQFTTTMSVAVAFTVLMFVCSNVMVLVIFLPSSVAFPDVADLQAGTDRHWDAVGWERNVASVSVVYLTSLRAANQALAKRLALAVGFQAAGVLGAAVLALAVLDSVR